MYMVLDTLSLM